MRLLLKTGLAALFLAGCDSGQQPQSLVTAADYADNLYVALQPNGQQQSVFLSSPDQTTLGICLLSAGENCSASHSSYRIAKEVYRKNGRILLAPNNSMNLTDGQQLVVIQPTDGTVVAAFQLSSNRIDPIEGGLALIQEPTLRQELSFLASDEHKGRLSGTPENEKIADWLIEELKKINVGPLNGGDYRQRFTMRVGPTSGQSTANIIGVIPGNDPELREEYIVVGAHMDHAGTLTRGYTCSNGGENNICNGADDNGSGTIAVLNIARALAKVRGSLKRSVLVMWFSGEEEGLIGSKHYVANPLVPLDKTVYMMNLDMVGYMRSFGGLAALGGGTSAEGQRILRELDGKYSDVNIRISQQPGGGSDHAPFMNRGIPGVFLHTGVQNNTNYHKTSDTADKIDYKGMLAATRIGFETLVKLASLDQEVVDYSLAGRQPFVSEEELQQSCHSLILNPFAEDIGFSLDFRYGNRP